jgi:hypothetical protein
MIRKSMEIIGYPEPAVQFEPSPGTEFRRIHEQIPKLNSYEESGAFRIKLEEKVQTACGNSACKARVSITATPAIGGDGEHIVQASYIKCSVELCPLRGPDSSGDREPRSPKPPLPRLTQSLPVEQDEPLIELEHLIGSHL